MDLIIQKIYNTDESYFFRDNVGGLILFFVLFKDGSVVFSVGKNGFKFLDGQLAFPLGITLLFLHFIFFIIILVFLLFVFLFHLLIFLIFGLGFFCKFFMVMFDPDYTLVAF